MTRKFGRIESFDDRSREYPVAAVAPSEPQTVVWPCQTWLDQGSEGSCVGHALAHVLACEPKPAPVDSAFAVGVYHDAQRIDEFPGGAYAGADPRMEGTSVLAGVKTVRRRGLVSSYRWAFGADDLRRGLLCGPAILGVTWYAGMSRPRSGGIVTPTGTVMGGHAICCRGYDAQRGLFVLRNSWGRRWGADGDCLISFADMGRLLQGRGEACFPVKGAARQTLFGRVRDLFPCLSRGGGGKSAC